jgi:uncharacterized protein YdcH (DUF465 family)
MSVPSEALKDQLLQSDAEFNQLASQHHELEHRLHELTAKSYLSEPEQREEVTLKKRKLQLKDRMEDIHRAAIGHSPPVDSYRSGRLAVHRRRAGAERRVGTRGLVDDRGPDTDFAAFFGFFFRDPDRQPPAGEDAVVSPADGRVLVARPAIQTRRRPARSNR